MDWSLEIKRAENGFVVKWWEELEDDKWDEKNQVFEELDSDGLDVAKALLHFVMEHFDIRGSKHDTRRLEVEIVEQKEKEKKIEAPSLTAEEIKNLLKETSDDEPRHTPEELDRFIEAVREVESPKEGK